MKYDRYALAILKFKIVVLFCVFLNVGKLGDFVTASGNLFQIYAPWYFVIFLQFSFIGCLMCNLFV